VRVSPVLLDSPWYAQFDGQEALVAVVNFIQGVRYSPFCATVLARLQKSLMINLPELSIRLKTVDRFVRSAQTQKFLWTPKKLLKQKWLDVQLVRLTASLCCGPHWLT
jgi:hypothetical protein